VLPLRADQLSAEDLDDIHDIMGDLFEKKSNAMTDFFGGPPEEPAVSEAGGEGRPKQEHDHKPRRPMEGTVNHAVLCVLENAQKDRVHPMNSHLDS
jgi:hypothetical protein